MDENESHTFIVVPDNRQRDPVEKAQQGSLLFLLNLTLKRFRFNSDSMLTKKIVHQSKMPKAGLFWKYSQIICWRRNYDCPARSRDRQRY
jgi:hypothetical protein